MMEGNGSVSLLEDSELIPEENLSISTPEAALLASSASEVDNIVVSDSKQNEVESERSKTVVNHIPLEPECVILPKSKDCDSDYEPTAFSLPSHDSQIEVGMAENGKPETTGTSDHLVEPKPKIPNLQKHIGIRSLVAFWLLGLCNNYGYVVMLSAAHDILGRDYKEPGSANVTTTTPAPHNARDCNEMSTGAILLADIIPSLLIKMTAPFFPLLIHVRLGLVILLSISGYVLVGASTAPWMALSGVVATAFASGLGEASLLSYMAFYKDSDVISTWSSGTGGAGFFGSLSYAFLTSIGISPAMTLYGLSSVPILMAVTFWCILKHPKLNEKELQVESPTSGSTTSAYKYSDEVPLHTTEDTFMEKLRYIPNLFQFMIPIGLVYLFEYFINQGLFELVYFKNIWLNHSEQYRWYQVLYQIGVFVSRSSLRLIQIRFLWLLGLLQFVNVILFLIQSIFSAIPSIYVIMVAVFWEGLLGGAAYVNTFHRITVEVPASKREFSMAITSLADALGITLAGITSLPVHNYICKLPDYKL